MSGSKPPDSPPPEVPEEFAATYRAAYEQAMAAHSRGPEQPGDREERDEDPPAPTVVGRAPAGRREPASGGAGPWGGLARVRDTAWFVPVLLGLLAALLIGAAYAVGRQLAETVESAPLPGDDPSLVLPDRDDADTGPETEEKRDEDAWDGDVTPVEDLEARASCTAKPGRDASGREVTYEAANLVDGRLDTAWRCRGTATGEKVTLSLGEAREVGRVGLVPGYAKTDERSGADRYAQNNRVTRLRWTLGDTSVVQRVEGAANDRSMRLLRVPRSSTDTVVLEVLAVRKGPRNTTAISEVRVERVD